MKPEAAVQQRVRLIYEGAGGVVKNLAQGYRPGGRRHATTRQAKGIADLLVFLPRRNVALWHEVKALETAQQLALPDAEREALYRKRQTPEQRAFEELCNQCLVPYILGGTAEAVRFLDGLGLVYRDPVEEKLRTTQLDPASAVV